MRMVTSGTHINEEEEEEERHQKLDHKKKSLFCSEIRLFTSTVKSWMGSSASCHGQNRRMKIEEVKGLVEVEVEVEELRVTRLESLRMK
jgi:hypothetical protein